MNTPVDFCTGLAVVLVLVWVARRPRPVRRATAVVMSLVAAALLGANLRTTGWRAEFGGVEPPGAVDPVTRALFWRGWPLSPCTVCLVHGLRFHPTGAEQGALLLDGVLFVAALGATRAACERYLGHPRERNP